MSEQVDKNAERGVIIKKRYS